MAKERKQRTNIQVVTDLMNFSDFGALAQLFVVDALTKWSAKVAASDPREYPEDGLVNGRAWIGVAKEISRKLDDAYGRR